MFKERYQKIKSAWQNEKQSLAEFHEFSKIFDPLMPISGVLTCKDSEEIDPLLRGLMVARNSDRLFDKLRKGKEPTENEKREVREAAWLTSIGGAFDISFDPDNEETSILINIDNSDLLDLWSINRESVVAYFVFSEGKKHLKRIQNTGFEISAGEFPLKFDFPNGIDSSFYSNLFIACADKQKYIKNHFVLLRPELLLEND